MMLKKYQGVSAPSHVTQMQNVAVVCLAENMFASATLVISVLGSKESALVSVFIKFD